MKRTLTFKFILLLTVFALASCSERGPMGPEGPRGPQGPQGSPGPEILPITFEFNASLTANNGFEYFTDIPSQIDVIESDVVLVFVLEDYIPEDDLDVWRKLPIIEFNNRGTLLFDYDFTLVDIRLFLDASYNLGVSDGFQDVLIRAVHIPSDFLAKARSNDTLKDIATYDELEAYLGVSIKKLGK
jgi:hypothetical protein